MIDIFKVKTNKPTVALENYFYLVPGVPKAGKTSLFARFVEKYFGDLNKGLLLAAEKGYSALRVNAIDISDWDDAEEVVEQLIENKDKVPYSFLGFDTAELFWQYAQDKVIKEWNARNPQKRAKEIGEVGAKGDSNEGFGVGYNMAKKKVHRLMDRLMKAGYGIMVITHSKDKEVKEKSGLKYDQLVPSLSSSARDVFVNMADFIVFVTIEKEMVGKSLETKRYLYFRSDGYVEAGGRFSELPVRIEYDVDNFIATVKNAIRAEYESEAAMRDAAQEQEAAKEQAFQQFIQEEKVKATAGMDTDDPAELVEHITELLADMDIDRATKDTLTAIFKEETGKGNYTKCEDAEALKKCIARIKALS